MAGKTLVFPFRRIKTRLILASKIEEEECHLLVRTARATLRYLVVGPAPKPHYGVILPKSR